MANIKRCLVQDCPYQGDGTSCQGTDIELDSNGVCCERDNLFIAHLVKLSKKAAAENTDEYIKARHDKIIKIWEEQDEEGT